MIEFFIPGQARPGGSKTTGARKDGKRFCRPARKDCQVVEQINSKKWGPQAGLLIRITQLAE